MDVISAIALLVVGQWAEAKRLVDGFIPLDNAVLHLVAGLSIYIIVVRVARRDRPEFLGWLTVFLVAVLNEASDLLTERWPDPGAQYVEALTDLGWTLACPTILIGASILAPPRRAPPAE